MTQGALGKSIAITLVLNLGMKTWMVDILLQRTPCLILCSSTRPHGCLSQIGYLITAVLQVQIGVQILVSLYLYSVTSVTDLVKWELGFKAATIGYGECRSLTVKLSRLNAEKWKVFRWGRHRHPLTIRNASFSALTMRRVLSASNNEKRDDSFYAVFPNRDEARGFCPD